MGLIGVRDMLFLAFCIAVHFVYRSRRRALLPYPPGLPGWPLIGNAFSIPTEYGHKFYQALGKRLGSGIIYLEAFGTPMVVLNDAHIARDLLEKRSALYSSRPHSVMGWDIINMQYLFGIMPYGDQWRIHRRLFQQYFSPKALHREQETELDHVRKGLLPNLYQSPQDLHDHVRSYVGGISISMTYGLQTKRTHDPAVQSLEEAFTCVTGGIAPGKYLVEVLPILRHVPEWAPGAEFKRFGRKARGLLMRVMEEPYQITVNNMENGTARVSFVADTLERNRNMPDYELYALHTKQTASQIYGAASETTVGVTMTFILAMLKYPDVQRRVQQEMDLVVGHGRLPDFSDKPHLPYLAAVLKEVLRWNPLAPLGLPHFTTDEDAYEGYYIPKGSVIIPNIYAMLQDENVYPDPSAFKPERFFKEGKLSADVPDPEVYASFGLGRRICPGAHIGLSALYIAAASITALFDILPELDAKGNPIEVVPGFAAASVVSEPLPFGCKITPRQGKNVESLLKEYLDVEII